MSNDENWTQRDGTKVAVGNMTEAHAKNALRQMIRTARIRKEAAAEQAAIDEQVDEDLRNLPPSGCDEYGSLG